METDNEQKNFQKLKAGDFVLLSDEQIAKIIKIKNEEVTVKPLKRNFNSLELGSLQKYNITHILKKVEDFRKFFKKTNKENKCLPKPFRCDYYINDCVKCRKTCDECISDAYLLIKSLSQEV